MKKIKIGGHYVIHCYKHDGKIHKIWEEAVLLEIGEEYLVFGNDRTKVIESDGRSWKTREPAIMFFFCVNLINATPNLVFLRNAIAISKL